MKSIFGLRGRRFAIATMAIFAVAGGVAYASIPDSSGMIHGCYANKDGSLRVIDTGSGRCDTKKETPLDWNQAGPKGDQGIQGVQGLPGVDGKDGTNGSKGTDGVSPTVTQVAADDPNCPAGGAAIKDAAGTTAYVCNGQNGHDGQPGADGQPFSGTFTSPNGQYSISVTNSGVSLAGVGGLLITLSGSNVTVQSSGVLSLKGSTVGINGGSCAPAARLGDSVLVNPFSGGGSITHGSSTVCIG